ncbi:uncharacterized protein LOC112513591 [Cynara cardunculus var. scolymus]|uniref:Uncharacterized protein n=1 Tax=Cynara cardunculus var. scolymus TaxID=59895 RepID=A0A103Y4R9_CYNCS|nr:uncharacterized protein LOC112513591 [Cynara cardunculus var. scolymus]KVI02502.1 hypothetical protein Ccrd_019258 [Cynara cardunculus var. scolymus]
MTPATGFSYHRLQNEGDNDYEEEMKRAIDHVKSRIQRSSRLKRVHMRKRLKMKIPSLRKFVRRRARVVMVSMAKVLKRLKDSQSHFGDLFAGNYLFMQVNPAPLKSSSSPYAINHGSIKRIEDELRRPSPRVS